MECGFSTRWNFPGCIGAIDGKHVLIRCPKQSGSTFYNYKGSFSLILLALVDSNYCFTYVDVGAAGRESDGGVFSRCSLKKAIESKSINMPKHAVIVGDDAFPLKTYLLKPFSRNCALSYEQKVFNYRLSRARRISENAFGILAAKFRIFEKPIPLSPEKVDKIILACCSLHNWLRKASSTNYLTPGLLDHDNLETGEIQQGSWRKMVVGGLRNIRSLGTNNHAREAALIRNKYAEFFVGPGKVPWQNEMI